MKYMATRNLLVATLVLIPCTFVLPGCESAASKTDNQTGYKVTHSGLITNYEAPGNLASTHKVSCTNMKSASNTWTPADIYPAVAQCVQEGHFDDAVELFALAGSYSRFDTMRVTDQSAWDASTVLEMQYMSNFTPEQQDAFQKAVNTLLKNSNQTCADLISVGPPNYTPTYMLQHGMGAFLKNQPNGGLVKGFDKNAAWSKVLHDYAHCITN
jgi:hypothetical protein